MEDRHVIHPDLNALLDLKDMPHHSYYAVFDGHAGMDAASYASAHLHVHIVQHPAFLTDTATAIEEAYKITDENLMKWSAQENMKNGCTALCALFREQTVYLSWIGDSQAVLVKDGRASFVSNPHKPDNEEEIKRITDAGGSVLNIYGTMRVDGILAVARAFGDPDYKPYVCSVPEICKLELDGTEDFLILACDGLWDGMSPDSAISTLYNNLLESSDNEHIDTISAKLVHKSIQQGSEDNITVIVLLLRDLEKIKENAAKYLAQSCITVDYMQINGGEASLGAGDYQDILIKPTVLELNGSSTKKMKNAANVMSSTGAGAYSCPYPEGTTESILMDNFSVDDSGIPIPRPKFLGPEATALSELPTPPIDDILSLQNFGNAAGVNKDTNLSPSISSSCANVLQNQTELYNNDAYSFGDAGKEFREEALHGDSLHLSNSLISPEEMQDIANAVDTTIETAVRQLSQSPVDPVSPVTSQLNPLAAPFVMKTMTVASSESSVSVTTLEEAAKYSEESMTSQTICESIAEIQIESFEKTHLEEKTVEGDLIAMKTDFINKDASAFSEIPSALDVSAKYSEEFMTSETVCKNITEIPIESFEKTYIGEKTDERDFINKDASACPEIPSPPTSQYVCYTDVHKKDTMDSQDLNVEPAMVSPTTESYMCNPIVQNASIEAGHDARACSDIPSPSNELDLCDSAVQNTSIKDSQAISLCPNLPSPLKESYVCDMGAQETNVMDSQDVNVSPVTSLPTSKMQTYNPIAQEADFTGDKNASTCPQIASSTTELQFCDAVPLKAGFTEHQAATAGSAVMSLSAELSPCDFIAENTNIIESQDPITCLPVSSPIKQNGSLSSVTNGGMPDMHNMSNEYQDFIEDLVKPTTCIESTDDLFLATDILQVADATVNILPVSVVESSTADIQTLNDSSLLVLTDEEMEQNMNLLDFNVPQTSKDLTKVSINSTFADQSTEPKIANSEDIVNMIQISNDSIILKESNPCHGQELLVDNLLPADQTDDSHAETSAVDLQSVPAGIPEAEGVTEDIDSDSEKDGGWSYMKGNTVSKTKNKVETTVSKGGKTTKVDSVSKVKKEASKPSVDNRTKAKTTTLIDKTKRVLPEKKVIDVKAKPARPISLTLNKPPVKVDRVSPRIQKEAPVSKAPIAKPSSTTKAAPPRIASTLNKAPSTSTAARNPTTSTVKTSTVKSKLAPSSNDTKTSRPITSTPLPKAKPLGPICKPNLPPVRSTTLSRLTTSTVPTNKTALTKTLTLAKPSIESKVKTALAPIKKAAPLSTLKKTDPKESKNLANKQLVAKKNLNLGASSKVATATTTSTVTKSTLPLGNKSVASKVRATSANIGVIRKEISKVPPSKLTRKINLKSNNQEGNAAVTNHKASDKKEAVTSNNPAPTDENSSLSEKEKFILEVNIKETPEKEHSEHTVNSEQKIASPVGNSSTTESITPLEDEFPVPMAVSETAL